MTSLARRKYPVSSSQHPGVITQLRQHSSRSKMIYIVSSSVESGKAIVLTLLDLSAAFNTIDHSILHDCLGPLVFTLYNTPLSQVISSFKVTHADDTQILGN